MPRTAMSIVQYIAMTTTSLPLSNKTVDLTYQSITFRIPTNYLQYSSFETDRGRGLHLGVLAETFEPLTAETAPIFRTAWLAEGLRLYLSSYLDRTIEEAILVRFGIQNSISHLSSREVKKSVA